MDVKFEIMRRVETLPLQLQLQILAYIDAVREATPRGETGRSLLPFAGVLDDVSASEMCKAIEAGCEDTDARDW